MRELHFNELKAASGGYFSVDVIIPIPVAPKPVVVYDPVVVFDPFYYVDVIPVYYDYGYYDYGYYDYGYGYDYVCYY